MFHGVRILAANVLAFGLIAGPVMAHGAHKHVCKKDGKVIKVKGKTEDDKKAACEVKGGIWVEEGDDD